MIAKTGIIEQPQLFIAGISVRTINKNGQSKKDMMALWQRFMQNNLAGQIHDKASEAVCCVYTDYEADYKGYYTAVLGCKVNSINNLPDGFTGVTVPAGRYQVCYLAGNAHDSVLTAWQEIWDSEIERKYTADYEVYNFNTKSVGEAEMKIYLAVR